MEMNYTCIIVSWIELHIMQHNSIRISYYAYLNMDDYCLEFETLGSPHTLLLAIKYRIFWNFLVKNPDTCTDALHAAYTTVKIVSIGEWTGWNIFAKLWGCDLPDPWRVCHLSFCHKTHFYTERIQPSASFQVLQKLKKMYIGSFLEITSREQGQYNS